MSEPRAWGILVACSASVWLALAGCAGRGGRSVVEPLPGILQSADLAWEARGVTGFEPVADALTLAVSEDPRSPEVAWRRVRYHVGLALAAPSRLDAVTELATGREIGMRCLDAAPGFSRLRRDAGWFEAVQAVDAGREGCLVWTTWAWIRWYATFDGEGAALDLDALDALLARTIALDDPPTELVPWMRGVLAAARPRSAGRDLGAARTALEAAVAARPGELPPRLDLAVLVGAPLGDVALVREQLAAIASAAPETPEDRRARARADALRDRYGADLPDDAPGRELLYAAEEADVDAEEVLPDDVGEEVEEVLPDTP